MEATVILTYIVCDDTIKNLQIKEDPQVTMSLAEIMTTALISATHFSGNFEKGRIFLKEGRYFSSMLSKSQFGRRLSRVDNRIWQAILDELGKAVQEHTEIYDFFVDSCPMYGCKPSRKKRSKIHQEKKFQGYCASQKQFFTGLKLHLVCDDRGRPVNFVLLPASVSDIEGLKTVSLDKLPKNSRLTGDKAYNDYGFEDRLIQEKQIHLLPIRKSNSKRGKGGYFEKIRRKKRKIIETAFSCIEKLMPRHIHAVTTRGFQLKATLFVLAYAIKITSF